MVLLAMSVTTMHTANKLDVHADSAAKTRTGQTDVMIQYQHKPLMSFVQTAAGRNRIHAVLLVPAVPLVIVTMIVSHIWKKTSVIIQANAPMIVHVHTSMNIAQNQEQQMVMCVITALSLATKVAAACSNARLVIMKYVMQMMDVFL